MTKGCTTFVLGSDPHMTFARMQTAGFMVTSYLGEVLPVFWECQTDS